MNDQQGQAPIASTSNTVAELKNDRAPLPASTGSNDADSASTAQVTVPELARSRARRKHFNSKLFEQYAIVVMLAALIALFGGLEPARFLTLGNLQTTLTTEAALLILTVAVSIALAAGEFDLSIAGVIGLSAVLLVKLPEVLGIGFYPSMVIVILIALAIGATNSFFTVRVGANSLIVTLAMGTLLEGLSLGISGSETLGNINPSFLQAMQTTVGGIGVPFWGAFAFGLLLWFMLEHTPTGRYVLFSGEGREAARLAGVKVNRMRTLGLITASLGACLAGLIIAGQSAAASATFGNPYLLQSLAAAFLGTTTIKVGRFNVIGSMIGVALLAVGTTGLELLGLSTWSADVFDGGVLIAAVAFAQIARIVRARQA